MIFIEINNNNNNNNNNNTNFKYNTNKINNGWPRLNVSKLIS